jgi:hypothetical protein
MINGKIHYKWSFSIAMLNYQRVTLTKESFRLSKFGVSLEATTLSLELWDGSMLSIPQDH